MTHSILPPSSAGIWGPVDGCTGWVKMAQRFPEIEQTEEAREGDAAHEIGKDLVNAAARLGMGAPIMKDIVGTPAPNGVVYTEEMFEGAEVYANDVATVMRDTAVFGGPMLGVEKRTDIKRVHDVQFGTPDCYLFDQRTHTLYVWDFKYGYGLVEAYENWQTINYVPGILNELQVINTDHVTVKIRIVQPRAFHRDGEIREWTVSIADLEPYFNQLSVAALEAVSPNAIARSGDHCKHCSGRHACEAALKGGVALYEAATSPMPIEMSPDAAGTQYAIIKRARKQLECLEAGYEEQIKNLLRNGQHVVGFAVEQSYGREKWVKPVEEVINLGELLGHELRKPAAITPNQARKLGIDDAVIMAYSDKPAAGIKLVEDNGTKAKRIFQK